MALGILLTMAVLAAAPAARSGGTARSYSLLIGISDYPPLGERNSGDLPGCQNDLRTMREILRRAGFPEDAAHQRVLVSPLPAADALPPRDGGRRLMSGATFPTARNLVAGLKWLIEKAGPADRVAIYYSGHGIYLPDKDGDEPDGYDEALCPADDVLITDDLLGLALARIGTDNVTFIADSCFSGTVTRATLGDVLLAELGGRAFRLRRAAKPLPALSKASARLPEKAKPPRGSGDSAVEADPNRVVVLSGCQPWEVSIDGNPALEIGDIGDHPYRGGVMTSLLWRAVRTHGIGASWRAVVKHVKREASIFEPAQEPMAEGPLGRRLFQLDTPRPGPTRGAPARPSGDLDVRLATTAFRSADEAVPLPKPEREAFRRELVQAVREDLTGLGGFRFIAGEGLVELAAAKLGTRDPSYATFIPLQDGTLRDPSVRPRFREAVEAVAGAIRFAVRLRQLAALHRSEGPGVEILTNLGPAPQVREGAQVGGALRVSEPCAVVLFRLDPLGKVLEVARDPNARPGTDVKFAYQAGRFRGKEVLKAIALPSLTGVPTVDGLTDPLAAITTWLADKNWGEDQHSLYIGDWQGETGAGLSERENAGRPRPGARRGE